MSVTIYELIMHEFPIMNDFNLYLEKDDQGHEVDTFRLHRGMEICMACQEIFYHTSILSCCSM